MQIIHGTARADRRTKDLVKRLQPFEIAVIDHRDIDEVSAEALVSCKVKAVVNADASISGAYPNIGPYILAEAGIYLLDKVGHEILDLVREGMEVEIVDNKILIGDKWFQGSIQTKEKIKTKMEVAKDNLKNVLGKFVQNTLDYAQQEMDLITSELPVPDIRSDIKGRHVLIVVRGQNYKEDLNAIRSYIGDVKPVLIGVDGGADALVELGLQPDIVIGDMDSISDRTLKSGAEIIVHAYPDGRAPGLKRIEELGLCALTFPMTGTSEDVAMLLAYEMGADLIVAVGTHSHVIDFLEKGRKGMASTMLVRMKVGAKLVDAKGVNKLYRRGVKFRYVAGLIAAAAIPIIIVAMKSPATMRLLRLVWLNLKIIIGS